MSQQQGPSKEGGPAADPAILAGPSASAVTESKSIPSKDFATPASSAAAASTSIQSDEPELDEFGLPVFRPVMTVYSDSEDDDEDEGKAGGAAGDKDASTVELELPTAPLKKPESVAEVKVEDKLSTPAKENEKPVEQKEIKATSSKEEKPLTQGKEAKDTAPTAEAASTETEKEVEPHKEQETSSSKSHEPAKTDTKKEETVPTTNGTSADIPSLKEAEAAATSSHQTSSNEEDLPKYTATPEPTGLLPNPAHPNTVLPSASPLDLNSKDTKEEKPTISEWSHQQVVSTEKKKATDFDDLEWQEMPSYAPFDLYNDEGKLVAKEHHSDEEIDEEVTGGASKGYTRVQMDEDAKSTTSMDENTEHLFKEADDEFNRNPLSQLETTKELLTEGQRIAYVGLCRLALADMLSKIYQLNSNETVKRSWARKSISIGCEHMRMWSQIVMVRLYKHMDISPAEQVMIEQLSEHGVIPADLTPTLMKNARVKNPMAAEPEEGVKSPRASTSGSGKNSPPNDAENPAGKTDEKKSLEKQDLQDSDSDHEPPPPAYEEHMNDELPAVKMPSQLPDSKLLDIDIRWTILCDLFLVLVSDSVYDARSRVLLELVGKYLSIDWIDICKFEKKVTDALEMQEGTTQNWNETDILQDRAKRARNRRYAMMGLATLGGGLVIGLSAGLLAPVIGAGLAAGFTGIGITTTGAFLGGTGGVALITTTGAVTGSAIAGKAAGKRTKEVSVFEFRPLYNNKRVNLIVTISGWMNGKEDDVRLPYSTVDPIMGDIFSVLWEPEMMQSMGQTINILATEVLTQSLQQVLGSTVLTVLMAGLQVPLILTKLSYLLDNPWSVSLDRAWASGLILADTLIQRNLGVRPITLVGFSLGARVIYSCLLELAKRNAHGLVQNVYMFGSPVVANRDDYIAISGVVRGRFVNGYASTDWILGYLFRATSGGLGRVAGLAAVNDVPGLENVDCTDYVVGHMSYRTVIPSLLKKVGWEVISEEFTEIEEADPDQHRERQIELIGEIEAARKELEKEPKKKWGLWGKNKDIAKKQDWETYSEDKREEYEDKRYDSDGGGEGKEKKDENVLFDVEAIRRELALQEVEEKERIKNGEGKPDPMVTSRPAMTYASNTGPGYDAGFTDSLNVGKKRTSTSSIGSNPPAPVPVSTTPKIETKSPAGTVRTSRNFSFGLFGRKNSGADKTGHSHSVSANASRTGSVTDLGSGTNGGSTPDLRRNSSHTTRMSTSSYKQPANEAKSPYHGYSYDDEFGDDAQEGRIQLTFEDSKWDYDEDRAPPPVPKKQVEQKRAVSYWGQSSSVSGGTVTTSPSVIGNEWSNNTSPTPSGGALPVLNKGAPGVPQRHSSLSYYTPAPGLQPASNKHGSGGNESGLGISNAGTNNNGGEKGGNKPLPSNPWADEDDEFGGEKEMTMSFE